MNINSLLFLKLFEVIDHRLIELQSHILRRSIRQKVSRKVQKNLIQNLAFCTYLTPTSHANTGELKQNAFDVHTKTSGTSHLISPFKQI